MFWFFIRNIDKLYHPNKLSFSHWKFFFVFLNVLFNSMHKHLTLKFLTRVYYLLFIYMYNVYYNVLCIFVLRKKLFKCSQSIRVSLTSKSGIGWIFVMEKRARSYGSPQMTCEYFINHVEWIKESHDTCDTPAMQCLRQIDLI